MKLSLLSSAAALAQLVLSSPTPTERDIAARANIQKRATITDIANLGYATQNGGWVKLGEYEYD